MKSPVLVLAFAVSSALLAETFPIWPDGKIPFASTNAAPERVLPTTDDIVRYTDVSVPTLTRVPVPADPENVPGPAVIVCPGGGYSILAWNHEGTAIGQWFKERGVTAFILKYRCPDRREAAFADVLRAVRFVRANAMRFAVDPEQIGVIGFSAGANLAVRVSTCAEEKAYDPVDAFDKVSARPNWQMIVYPWDLVPWSDKNKRPPVALKPMYKVDKKTPPAFVVQTQDDFAFVENALAYHTALTAAGVKCEMHLFEKGGHGYGIRKTGEAVDLWPTLAESWLSEILGD